MKCILIFLLFGLCSVRGWIDVEDPRADPSVYNIGVGIYDATGPAAGVNMMGYANPAQINSGIHLRLFSRAFIVDDGMRRVVFVSVDCGMMGENIKKEVLSRLEEHYGALYSTENVIISGTHTHSGPAGFLQYLLFDVTSLGFIKQTFDAMVEGIVQSIMVAHNNMNPGHIFYSKKFLLNASINRSPTAYLNNPEEEKDSYIYDTDKEMTLVRFEDLQGTPLGIVNWFAVHPTSMNNTNTLVSGDNKGYASYLFEEAMNPPGTLPGKGAFVAAFAQANCGDVSPNINGPHCQDTGDDCDLDTSTCNGKTQLCVASGPGDNMVESTQIIGQRQFNAAMELFNDDNATQLVGPLQYVQQYIDMANFTFSLQNGTEVTTCRPALGFSFAAGTTDGPGAFDFTQGMTESNPFWNTVVDTIYETPQDQIDCQAPKPILLDTGDYNSPYPWHPRIMDTQIARIGQLLILAVPGEFTTMAGRRLRDLIFSTAENEGLANPVPVIAGLSNVYSHYITTVEEYAIQRYEGASTIFGPNTLEAYMNQYKSLLTSIARNDTLPPGPLPPDLMDQQLTLLPPVLFDSPHPGTIYGEVIAHPYPLAYTGETVIAKFVTSHPRNDMLLGDTYMTVEKKETAQWKTIATDSSWNTRFEWSRMSILLGTSEATLYWDIPQDALEGTYRMTHKGTTKAMFRTGITFEGYTNEFQVLTAPTNETEKLERTLPEREQNWFSKLMGHFM